MNFLVKKAIAQGGIIPDSCSSDPINCVEGDLYTLIGNIYEFLIGLGAIIATGFFLWGAFLLIISSGSPERITQGKDAMMDSIVGFIIVITSYVVINTLMELFTDCSGWAGFSC